MSNRRLRRDSREAGSRGMNLIAAISVMQRHRRRHQQRQPPAHLGEQAGQHQAEREPARPEGGVHADGPGAHRAFVERGGEQGQPGRGGEGRRDALDEPGGDQQADAADQPAEQRGHREQGESGQEDAPPSQQVSGAAAEKQQAAVAEYVAADHPLQRRRGQPEVGADVGQGHADHRYVERVEEQGHAEHDQDGPQPRAPPLGAGPLGRRWRPGGRTPGTPWAVRGRRDWEGDAA